MSSTVTTLPNGVVVVTHILPPGSEMGLAAAPSPTPCLGQTVSSLGQTVSSLGQTVSSLTEQFLKELGTVQIMIGLVVFLMGIVVGSSLAVSCATSSGMFVWGAMIYIIAGSLTVASAHKGLVKGSLGMNGIAGLVAVVGLILNSIDVSIHPWDQGIPGVLTLFSVMEMIISICVSAFLYRASRCSAPEQVFIVGNHLPQGRTMIPQVLTPPLYQTVLDPKGPGEGAILTAAHLNDQPPEYTPVSA